MGRRRPTVARRASFRRSRWLTPGRVLGDGRLANFTELLSLLVGHAVPLTEAMVLAADASGDGALRRGSRVLAERLREGQRLTRREDLPKEFPPLLGWLLVGGGIRRS